MKTNFTKLMSVALLFVATFMGVSCSKDNDSRPLTADDLISIFTEEGILVDGVLAEGASIVYLTVEDESEAVEFLEAVIGDSFDTSGEMYMLADGVSYINIVQSSTDGLFYNVTFSLSGIDDFEVALTTEAYLETLNAKVYSYPVDSERIRDIKIRLGIPITVGLI